MLSFKEREKKKRKKKENLLKGHLGLIHLKILPRQAGMLIQQGNGKCLPIPALALLFEPVL